MIQFDINKALNDYGQTALYVACQEGHVEIVNELLKHWFTWY